MGIYHHCELSIKGCGLKVSYNLSSKKGFGHCLKHPTHTRLMQLDMVYPKNKRKEGVWYIKESQFDVVGFIATCMSTLEGRIDPFHE